MNIRGELHHVTKTGVVVTTSTVGDMDDVGYSVIWRSGEDFTDILSIEHVDQFQAAEHYRSWLVEWGEA